MPDPYAPTTNVGERLRHRRPVRRYFTLAAMLLPIAVLTSIPGITLLNQEYGWYPTQSGIYDIEINGSSISNASAIRYSIGVALSLLTAGMLLSVITIRNWFGNKKMHRTTKASSP
jgi:hypothetical protein